MIVKEKLFRKVALDRLASPEQLDELMEVTTPKGWLALLTLGGSIVVALLWGIYGSVPDKVVGKGLFVKTGGIVDIVSQYAGQVTAVYPENEKIVEKGQTLARVTQPKLLEDLTKSKAELGELKAERGKVAGYGSEDIRLKAEQLAKQKSELNSAIRFARERVVWLRERLASQKQLLDQGLMIKQNYLKTQEELNNAIQEIERTQSQFKQLALDELQNREQRDRELLAKDQKISQLERQIADLEQNIEEGTRILSPYTGRVIEISAVEGKQIDRGGKILSMDLVGDNIKELEAVVYFKPGEGKRVQPGMMVQLVPSTVKQEEGGCMIGMVTYVAEFPSTLQGMMRSLQNDKLVQSLSSDGPPLEVVVDLIPDPNTASGYKWSSPKGPPLKIEPGTLCAGTVVIEEKPPITLVIPLFKKYFFGIGE